MTLSFITGILLARSLELDIWAWVYISIPLITMLGLLVLIFNKIGKSTTSLFTGIAFLLFISIGALNYTLQTASKHHSHYSSKSNSESSFKILRITQKLKDNKFYSKYYADVLSMDEKETSGTVLIQLKKDSVKPLVTDAVVITKSAFSDIQSAVNPGQFDYKTYLKNKGVYHQMYLENSNYKVLTQETTTFNGLNGRLIQTINSKLKNYRFSPDELAIINALVLGQKQDISSEIYDSYTDSGAIHILAVSGLHVGIILLIITFILKPLKQIKHGNLIVILCSIILLWLYAFLTGFSPSVIRATAMFTLVSIAINLKRKTNTYNTLIGSILIILIFQPQFLFDVGFQLSYVAVFSIVAFQPLIANLWHPKYKLTNLYWQTFTVTLSAQFGIIPLSVYYFHQIPGLFWLSNLIIIPLLPLILGLAILVIVLVLSFDKSILTTFFASTLSYSIYGMNYLLRWISSLESFIFKELSFSSFNLIASLLFVLSLYFLWKYFSAKTIICSLSAIILLQCSFMLTKIHTASNEFVIFHRSKHRLMSLKNNNRLTVYTDNLIPNYISTNYKVNKHINTVSYKPIPNILSFENKIILVIDSTGLYPKSLKPDYVILTQSPKININRLIDQLKPQGIISDGSNYKSYVRDWNLTAQNKKVLFHTTEKGAFILSSE
ncbi:ComEC/Rec2 family competence protein [Aurantibacter aestuarii]|uniref:ComEC/Rec2 family competence protein n=1 Tax=Aurantibacter aestuarii TaxID=1266046 RepID=UPI0015E63F28|nr:ComEC/Rec2 family competence protein [Aurantibacter aestuarii]